MKNIAFLVLSGLMSWGLYELGYKVGSDRLSYDSYYRDHLNTVRSVHHREDGTSILCLRMKADDALEIYYKMDGKAPLKIKSSCLGSIYE